MSILPEFLLNAYDSIYDSDIVKNKNITVKTIDEFVYFLNQSIPKKYTPEYTIYLFNRTKYKVNRWKFIKDIHDTPYKSMILWTNYKEILKHFDLVQRFYLKWDKESNQYVGDLYDPSKSFKQESEETNVEDIKNNKEEVPSSTEGDVEMDDQEKIEEYMDDQDRLFEYMQKKKKEMLESQEKESKEKQGE